MRKQPIFSVWVSAFATVASFCSMSSWLALVLFGLLVLQVRRRWKKYQIIARKFANFPGPKKRPIFGNVLELQVDQCGNEALNPVYSRTLQVNKFTKQFCRIFAHRSSSLGIRLRWHVRGVGRNSSDRGHRWPRTDGAHPVQHEAHHQSWWIFISVRLAGQLPLSSYWRRLAEPQKTTHSGLPFSNS